MKLYMGPLWVFAKWWGWNPLFFLAALCPRALKSGVLEAILQITLLELTYEKSYYLGVFYPYQVGGATMSGIKDN